MIRRHSLVEIKRLKELLLSTVSPPHHGPTPANHLSIRRNHDSPVASTRVLQHIPPKSGPASRSRNYFRRQLLVNAAIAASRVASYRGSACNLHGAVSSIQPRPSRAAFMMRPTSASIFQSPQKCTVYEIPHVWALARPLRLKSPHVVVAIINENWMV